MHKQPQFNSYKFEYNCTQCNKNHTKNVSYLSHNKNSKQVNYTSLWECPNRFCDAEHRLLYSLEKTQTELVFELKEFLTNDRTVNLEHIHE